MQELVEIEERVNPTEILLVADAMTGQEAVGVAADVSRASSASTGLILTKMDGDARGGAALSIRAVTGVPIKFIGIGEKTDALEPFYPDRLASRILGMGDVVVADRTAPGANERRRSQTPSGADVQEGNSTSKISSSSCRRSRRWGRSRQLLEMIPGIGEQLRQAKQQISDDDLKQVEAIIYSMTPDERRNPQIIGRRARAASPRARDVNPAEVKQAAQAIRADAEDDDRLRRDGEKGKDAARFPSSSALEWNCSSIVRLASGKINYERTSHGLFNSHLSLVRPRQGLSHQAERAL